ncbi:hypothetical protein IQ251_08025 [Saccharopolyspora sp. HNM0983]|uniref:Uncharacterized protein n=1 Tax=Saccharopolyspora montiporae TaxID=2781240 RepID=A0A929BAE4_9PSEU|nr:hypothetical protein [Saccharopolyspora sp. HNM0983]MBE9374396.1 hypothetical protein [Saccharopolyspora sp. HNM0983]
MQDQHTGVRDLERYADGQLDGIEWVAVHAHVQECEPCGRLAEQAQWFAEHRNAEPADFDPADFEDGDFESWDVENPDWPADPLPAPAEVHPPGWSVVAGAAAVAALVAFAVGRALGAG